MTDSGPLPHRVIGIGASAGGIEALLVVLAALPASFAHPICVVLHIPPKGEDMLAQVLDRRCEVRVRTARDGEPLLAGHVHVAPPDRHLLVRGGSIALTADPRENGVRPAIDPLLRSVATTCGPVAVAVVLSGALSDGALGARAVAQAGGRVLIQDPDEARVTSMPNRAIAEVGDAAEVRTAGAIGTELCRLARARLTGAGT